MNDRLALEPILRNLRDFQRRTVEYVFHRMYLDKDPAYRFLIADEVGLGKTLVARGIIAKTIRHLQSIAPRIDIVYVCSNAAIANQNINRLNVYGNKKFALATRLTLLPTQIRDLRSNKVNFISFTPGTTFDFGNRGGRIDERRVLYRMLRDRFNLSRTGLLNLLQVTATKERWRSFAEQDVEIDAELGRSFRRGLNSHHQLLQELRELDEIFHTYRPNIPKEDSNRRLTLVSELRRLLARTCIGALEPDLIILDEFQRFKELIHGDSEEALLAQALFQYSETDAEGREHRPRVLLLSATPYKMYTMNDETEDDHYSDFIKTLRFLYQEERIISELEQGLEKFRRELHGLGQHSSEEVKIARDALQNQIRRVMVRTERVSATDKRDAMLSEPPVNIEIKPADLQQAVIVDKVARALKVSDTVEYWKSSPYLLNFMKGYELKRVLSQELDRPSKELIEILNRGGEQLLRRKQFDRYQELNPANARLRSLLLDTVASGQWKLLWIPPSLPYWTPQDAYADLASTTKTLVFSAWQVVPDAIASLCSYEAERLMLAADPDRPRYTALTRERKPLLRFSSNSQERLSGLPVFALVYPCVTLAREIDPLAISIELGKQGLPSLEDVRRVVRKKIEQILRNIGCWSERAEGREDQRWYWAATAMLDARRAPWMRRWCMSENESGWMGINTDADEEPSSGFGSHVRKFVEFFEPQAELGRAPSDLLDVLTEISLSSPAVCAMRSLHRVIKWAEWDEPSLCKAAALVGEGFRSLFNLPETISLLRSSDTHTPYWRVALQHGLAGNLGSVLDEYFHWLRESLGVNSQDPVQAAEQIGEAASEAVAVRTTRIQIDQLQVRPRRGSISIHPFNVRCRYAMRFGDVKSDQEEKLARTETVQKAFNSPFRPFILATTSIGQEGLDFHPYCHVVYHWNLPANPVDLEQREGRVHRYKGHAIRKNVATHLGMSRLREVYRPGTDPWNQLFEFASLNRNASQNDLIPYWIYAFGNGTAGANVERRVPVLPFSREQQRLPELKASLAIYRLVFGQPRQEDLLAHLKERGPDEIAGWRFDFSPPSVQVLERKRDFQEEDTALGEVNLVCRRCGEGVAHSCSAAEDSQLHWQSGDCVMIFYPGTKDCDPWHDRGEVLSVNENKADLRFQDGVRRLRYRRANLLWDENTRENCRLVSHIDPSGGDEIALICPACGQHRQHKCNVEKFSKLLPFDQGAPLDVTYDSHPGLEPGTFRAFVARISGSVARVFFEYDNGETEITHLHLQSDGSWHDLDYGIPCMVKHPGDVGHAENC